MPYSRILSATQQSFLLFGARGTGKSTWIRGAFKEAHALDLLSEELYQALLADPARFVGELRGLKRGTWVVVDEVQRLPALLNEVHRAIEQQGLRFVLSGSSARKLKRSGVNLLGGRALVKNMHPFVPEELGDDFDLERALTHGTLPLVWMSPRPAETLKAYAQAYLREEIQAEALTRNLGGFARFLPIAAIFHGQSVNASSIARDAGVARTTVTGFLDVLEDTLLARRLPGFEPRLRVRERKHPKLYLIDAGIVRALKKQLGPLAQEEWGSLFEGWIANLLFAYGDHRDLYDELSYWAPTEAHKTEVDFLLTRGREHLAIEVKSNGTVDADALRGLRAIGDLPRLAKRILVYRGPRAMQTEEGIEVWPVAKFLENLLGGTVWP